MCVCCVWCSDSGRSETPQVEQLSSYTPPRLVCEIWKLTKEGKGREGENQIKSNKKNTSRTVNGSMDR